jgi:hypothetical protein
VRAFARTVPLAGALCDPASTDAQASVAMRTGRCIERLAFTNPIWVDNGADSPNPSPPRTVLQPNVVAQPVATPTTGTTTSTQPVRTSSTSAVSSR